MIMAHFAAFSHTEHYLHACNQSGSGDLGPGILRDIEMAVY